MDHTTREQQRETYGRRAEEQVEYRIGKLEEIVEDLQRTVSSVDQRLSTVRNEIVLVQKDQTHLSELLSLQFKALEASLATVGVNVKTLGDNVLGMAGDAHKSPVGQQFANDISELQTNVEIIKGWKNQISGGWFVIQVMSGMGLVSFILVILRMAGVVR